MDKNSYQLKMFGKPVTILGNQLKVGQHAPNFTVLDKDMSVVKLSDFKEPVIIINAVPSINTKVCDMQVQKFNKEVEKLKDVKVLSVSVDLPFSLDQYCSANGIKAVTTTSDHKELDFGKKYGLVIKDMRLLARAVIVLDKDKFIKHIEYVPEITDSPNFSKALETAKSLL